jgi:hypothetical protein
MHDLAGHVCNPGQPRDRRGRVPRLRPLCGVPRDRRAGACKHPDAIPFRRMSERFEIDGLEESLAEGIMVGHLDMPEFRFRPDDAQALTAYIASLQNTP